MRAINRNMVGWVLALLLGLAGISWALPASQASLFRPAQPRVMPAPEATELNLQAAYGRLRLHFEVNQGQTDAQVKFLARGPGYTLFLTSTEAVLVLQQPAEHARTPGSPGQARRRVPVPEQDGRRPGAIYANQAGQDEPNPRYPQQRPG